jgi:hypothetical protein
MQDDHSTAPTRKLDLAPEMLRDFQDGLRRSPVRAREADLQLAQALRERGFRLDGKHLRALQAPHLINATEVRELTRDVRTIGQLLEQVVQLALSSVAFMDQIGVSPNIEELALNDAPSRLAIEFARFDFIPTPGGARCRITLVVSQRARRRAVRRRAAGCILRALARVH